ncbi:MAG: hypothetical protein NC098_04730 [Lachnoclostridium sp.]|nr:hypothetical protein [Lachnoclostridium sp.]
MPQLIEFMKSGEVTFEELQQLGLPYFKQDEIRKFLAEKDIWEAAKMTQEGINNYLATYPNGFFVDEAGAAMTAAKEEGVWQWACDEDNVAAYKRYLSKYPTGKYAIKAEMRIEELEEIEKNLKEEIFNDMRENFWNYSYMKMRQLYNPQPLTPEQKDFLASQDDAYSRFVANGLKLTHQDLIDNGVVPEGVTQSEVSSPEFTMPATKIEELGMFPKDRTDIFFLGVPRSGKSSVLSGVIYQLWRDGFAGYEPQLVNGVDPCMAYYQGLIRAVATKKPPVGTATDTVSFMKIDLVHGKRRNKLTIVEMAGEAFKRAAERIAKGNGNQEEVWKELGAEQCLRSKNQKMLFFVLDYSAVKGINEACSAFDQLEILESALRTLSTDGPDPQNPRKGCTMSRVETVAVLVTKSDLMQQSTVQGRLAEARAYMEDNFKNFMRELMDMSREFGCNRVNDYRPYFLTFSLGNFYVGNTVVFNPDDSKRIIDFIRTATPSESIDRFRFFN